MNNVERRSTRRSTAENRLSIETPEVSEKNGKSKTTNNNKPAAASEEEEENLPSLVEKKVQSTPIPPAAEKENERKRSLPSKNKGTKEVVEGVEEPEKSIVEDEEEEEEDGTPEAKVAKLAEEEVVADVVDEEDSSVTDILVGEEEEEVSNGSSSLVDSEASTSLPPLKPRRKEKVTYPCPECDKKFLKKTFLTKHIKFHSAPRPFICETDECERTFTKASDLIKHQKIFHEGMEEGALHLCAFCQKAFITRAEMDNHAETHVHEYKMYACRYCGKTFVKKFQMKIAIQAATDQTPDPCPYCKKAINAKAYSDN
jgi:hypothetical protein